MAKPSMRIKRIITTIQISLLNRPKGDRTIKFMVFLMENPSSSQEIIHCNTKTAFKVKRVIFKISGIRTWPDLTIF